MIKHFLECILVMIITCYIGFNNKVSDCNKKIEDFYNSIEGEGITYIDNKQIYLVFDYEFIGNKAGDIFDDYNVKIDKQSEVYFILEIEVKELFFNKKLKENFMIRKGDIYEELN